MNVDFTFSFDADRLLALADLDADDPHFAERFFGLPIDDDEPTAPLVRACARGKAARVAITGRNFT